MNRTHSDRFQLTRGNFVLPGLAGFSGFGTKSAEKGRKMRVFTYGTRVASKGPNVGAISVRLGDRPDRTPSAGERRRPLLPIGP